MLTNINHKKKKVKSDKYNYANKDINCDQVI